MRRIGTTAEGGAIVEIGQAELVKLAETGDLLAEIAACALVDAGDQLKRDCQRVSFVAPEKLKKAAKKHGAAAGGMKVCRDCGVSKPESDFYDRSAKCKPCVLARQKAAKEAKLKGSPDIRKMRKAAGLKVVAAVAAKVKSGGSFLARERDPALDRPVSSGRVLPVGGEG